MLKPNLNVLITSWIWYYTLSTFCSFRKIRLSDLRQRISQSYDLEPRNFKWSFEHSRMCLSTSYSFLSNIPLASLVFRSLNSSNFSKMSISCLDSFVLFSRAYQKCMKHVIPLLRKNHYTSVIKYSELLTSGFPFPLKLILILYSVASWCHIY